MVRIYDIVYKVLYSTPRKKLHARIRHDTIGLMIQQSKSYILMFAFQHLHLIMFKLNTIYIIHDNFVTFETYKRYNNDPNWECHVSLVLSFHEDKLLSLLYNSINSSLDSSFVSHTQKYPLEEK